MALVSSRGGYKKLCNLPLPRSSLHENTRQLARVVLDLLYTQERLWNRISELDKWRKQIADLKKFNMAARTVMPIHEGITVFNAMTGSFVTHLHESQSRRHLGHGYVYTYHDLYQQVRCDLNVSKNTSVALIFRSSPKPCIFRAGEIIPAHRAGCMQRLRRSILDAVVHR